MILDALIVPQETCTTLREVKRALLTFNKVILIEPNDRDLMPRASLMPVATGMPIGIDMGPVRPLGKVAGYDEAFERLHNACVPAIQQNLVSIVSTYDRSESEGKTFFGNIPSGGYPLDMGFVFNAYRMIASNWLFLSRAIANDAPSLVSEMDRSPEFALHGAADRSFDLSINGQSQRIDQMPILGDLGERGADLTNIARGRIASFIKYTGYCETKELIPIYGNAAYCGLAAEFVNQLKTVFSDLPEDIHWERRNRILRLCHEEHLVDEALDQMSVEQVIRLRTTVWGNQAKAREGLFDAIEKLAKEIVDNGAFEQQAQKEIAEYRRNSEQLQRERESLKLRIKCDIGSAALASGPIAAGFLSQLQSPFASVAYTLVAGGIWAFDRTKEYVPQLRALQAAEQEMKRGAALGLHNFYSRFRDNTN